MTKILLGNFEVVQVLLGGITINIGKNVHITIHVGDFPHDVKAGDRLTLFTEIDNANTGPASIQ